MLPPWILPRRSLALSLLLAVASIVACDNDTTTTVRNESGGPVRILFDGGRIHPLVPLEDGESTDIGTESFEFPQRITAVDDATGDVLLDRLYTFDDLKAEDFLIVVRHE